MPHPQLERRAARWRHEGFVASDPAAARQDWPPVVEDPAPGLEGLYEIDASLLTAETLAGGILHHGGMLIRGLLSADETARLAAGIDHAFTACQAAHETGAADADSPWYWPFPLPAESVPSLARGFIWGGGGLLTADSPRMLFDLIDLCERKGLIDMIAAYFGERPSLSIGKSTLRRVPSTLKASDWHQDGAFLGEGIRSVNLWLALTPCGRDASGLDVVPRRIPYIAKTGTDGALFDWSVGPGVVDVVAEGTPVASPVFAAGDAMLFDHYFLHRTSLPPGMRQDRLAIESWFFASSAYPADQEPLML